MAQLFNSFTNACSNVWDSITGSLNAGIGTVNAGIKEVANAVTPRKRRRPSSASPPSTTPSSPASSAPVPPVPKRRRLSEPLFEPSFPAPFLPPRVPLPTETPPRSRAQPPTPSHSRVTDAVRHALSTSPNRSTPLRPSYSSAPTPSRLSSHTVPDARQHFFRRSYAALSAASSSVAPTPSVKPPIYATQPTLRKTVYKRRPLSAHKRLAATRALASSTRTHPKLYRTHPSPRLNSIIPAPTQKTPPRPPSQRDPSSPKSQSEPLPSPSQRAAQLAHLPPFFAKLLGADSRLSNKVWKVHHKRIERLAYRENSLKVLELRHFVARRELDQIRRDQQQQRRRASLRPPVTKPKPSKPQPERPPPRAAHFQDHKYWLPPSRDTFAYHLQPPQKDNSSAVTVTDPASAFAPLTEAAMGRLRAIFSDPSNQHKELSRIDGCIIRGQDLRTLKPNSWLNDEVVNAYMNLIAARAAHVRKKSSHDENAKPNGHPNALSNGYGLNRFRTNSPSSGSLLSSTNHVPKVKVISSFFYSTLFKFNPHTRVTEYNYSRVKRWTRRFNVFEYDIMLIPINQQNIHWTLGVIDFKNKTVAHLDSMGKGGSPEVRENLLRWVRDEAATKEHDFNDQEWTADDVPVPQQANSDDCGVFLCKYADFLSRGWSEFTFSQDHMNYFRARIAHELLMKKA